MSFAYNNMINVIGDIMAQYKIAVDAGHGGSDYGATYNGRAEKDDNLKLALAVGDILEKNGIDVVYTRTTDEYETPFKKATDANDAKADYFVSIHRNSSPTPNQYTGVETLVYNNSGNEFTGSNKYHTSYNLNTQGIPPFTCPALGSAKHQTQSPKDKHRPVGKPPEYDLKCIVKAAADCPKK